MTWPMSLRNCPAKHGRSTSGGILCSTLNDQQSKRTRWTTDCEEIPQNRLGTRLEKPTRQRGSWHHKIHVVCRDTWHCTHQWPSGSHPPDRHQCLSEVWAPRLQHKITECGEGPMIWNWTRYKMAIILRMDHKSIPHEWTLRPAFLRWPPQRQAAILWILAHLVHYRLQTHRRLSLRDYMDFLKHTRWQFCQQARTCPTQGRYLDVLDSAQPWGYALEMAHLPNLTARNDAVPTVFLWAIDALNKLVF